MTTLLAGITARRIPTGRLTVNVLEIADRSGVPVVFVHGNVSSSVFWQSTMLALPERYRPIAVDLRGFGDTDPEPVDATRGVRDYADDVSAVTAALELGGVHLVGWSMGGGVVLQQLVDSPAGIRSVTLVNPLSPFGFGGSHGAAGEVAEPAGVGSGGGCVSPEFLSRMAANDRGDESMFSPRQVLLAHYVKPPFVPENLDALVDSMLATRLGEDHYPGDSTTVDAWPGIAAGTRGVLNSLSPAHFRIDDITGGQTQPPVLWVRGADDVIVSDTSLYDFAFLGSLGAVPGWPGETQWPPQPMLAQTRHVLDGYAGAGGSFREVVIADAGHSPFLEQPAEFLAAFTGFLDSAD